MEKYLITSYFEYIEENLLIDITKNTKKAPYLGNRYGQDVEPTGTNVTKGKFNADGFINGKADLKNPLY